jgi:hypothetical protein
VVEAVESAMAAAMTVHKPHGTAMPPQHGLQGERQLSAPERAPVPGEKLLMIHNEGKNKRYSITQVESVVGDVVTVLHITGLGDTLSALALTWDAEHNRWFIWA